MAGLGQGLALLVVVLVVELTSLLIAIFRLSNSQFTNMVRLANRALAKNEVPGLSE